MGTEFLWELRDSSIPLREAEEAADVYCPSCNAGNPNPEQKFPLGERYLLQKKDEDVHGLDITFFQNGLLKAGWISGTGKDAKIMKRIIKNRRDLINVLVREIGLNHAEIFSAWHSLPSEIKLFLTQ